jgi:hypothetical protein
VLSIKFDDISVSDPFKVPTFVGQMGYHPPVLMDPGGKIVAPKFHVDGAVPKSYVLDRDGKLVAEAIDQRTQRQFLNMIAMAGIHP